MNCIHPMNHTLSHQLASYPSRFIRRAEPSLVPTADAGSWRSAVVLHVDGRDLRLRVEEGERPARQALGCLVTLQPGDQVIVFAQESGWWVTALLDRPGCQDMQLSGPEALELKAPRIKLGADEALLLEAPQTKLRCEQALVTGSQLQVIGASIKAIGKALSTFFDRANHHSKQHMRTTEGMDCTKAQHLELQAQQLLQARSQHMLIDGEKLVKTRGAQIHFG